MKRIFLSVLFICTFLSHLTAQTGKESELIKQNYIRSVIGLDESKQPFLQLLSKIPPEKRYLTRTLSNFNNFTLSTGKRYTD